MDEQDDVREMQGQGTVRGEAGGSLLERRFGIRARGSTVGREVVGGLASFLTLSYILFVQPAVMGTAAGDGSSGFHASVLTAVCAALLAARYIWLM